MKKYWFLFVFIILTNNCFSQQPAYFKFGEEQFEGVSIYDVIQDNEQNYIFATDQGVFFHDGYSYHLIESDDMKSLSVFNFVKDKFGTIYCHNLNQQVFTIINGEIKLFFDIPTPSPDISLRIDHNNRLIVSSEIVYILNNKGQIIHSSESISSNYLNQPFELKNNDFFIESVASSSYIALSNDTFSQGQLNIKEYSIHPEHELQTSVFFRLKNNTYSIELKSKTLYKFNEQTFERTYLKTLDWTPLSSSLRYYVIEDELWVAGNTSGLKIYDSELNSLFDSDRLFSDYFISDIYKDHEGNILLSTFDKGILVITNSKIRDIIPEFKNHTITKIVNGADSELYFGTSEGAILSYSNKGIQELYSNGSKGIDKIYKWPNTSRLFFDNSGLVYFDLITKKSKKILNSSFKDIAQISDNTFILALNTGAVYLSFEGDKYSIIPIPELKERTYVTSFEANSKCIYIVAASGTKVIHEDGTISSLKIKGEIVYASHVLSEGDHTYLSSRKHGFITLKNGVIQKIVEPKHNNDNLFITKFQICKNRVFANTQKGLIVMDFNGNVLNYLNKSKGVSVNRIIDFTITDKDLWISHARGVQRLELSALYKNNYVPLSFLASFEVNGENTTLINHLKFKSNQRKFKFTISVKTIKNRDNIRYHYKLEGNDDNWTTNDYFNNEITYNSLAPGRYTFLYRSENNGVFEPTKKYSFSIASPIYLKWWFSLLIILFVSIVIALIARHQILKQRKRANQLNELNASKLTAIQSQMNPHFIFNSLNSIQDLVLKGDINNSYTFITKFSNLVRRTLNYSDKDFIEFDQEIKLLEIYLSLEKLRFKEDLEYSIDFSGVEDILIPPMLIQPFIENALVHGLLHKEGPKNLTVRFILDTELTCEIIDNGIGREKSKEIKLRQRGSHESFSINAIKKRFEILEVHFGGSLGFEYIDLIDCGQIRGTKVILKIPFKNKF